MNADRRARLTAISEKLAALREEIGDIKGEEQEAYDNLPEGLQAAEKGERMSAAVDELDASFSDLESATDAIARAIE